MDLLSSAEFHAKRTVFQLVKTMLIGRYRPAVERMLETCLAAGMARALAMDPSAPEPAHAVIAWTNAIEVSLLQKAKQYGERDCFQARESGITDAQAYSQLWYSQVFIDLIADLQKERMPRLFEQNVENELRMNRDFPAARARQEEHFKAWLAAAIEHGGASFDKRLRKLMTIGSCQEQWVAAQLKKLPAAISPHAPPEYRDRIWEMQVRLYASFEVVREAKKDLFIAV